MSKLRALVEKELADLQVRKEVLTKTIEQTKQALIGREHELKGLNLHIEELQEFLAPKEKVLKKGKK